MNAHELLATLRDFRDKVAEMRDLQKRYFKGERDLLDQCRQSEKRVDRAIEDTADAHQAKLF